MPHLRLSLLSAGAAMGVVQAIAPRFLRETGATVEGTYGAVGAIEEMIATGAACDAVILSAALIDAAARRGRVIADSATPLGRVWTGIAVRAQDEAPAIGDRESLRAALLAADAIYFPDPKRSTAGIHFMHVLDVLDIRSTVDTRLCPYPNGAIAMRELAHARGKRAIGCTQVTEILYTPGVALRGRLPPEVGLGTVYTAAVCAYSAKPSLARLFVDRVGGDDARELRRAGGFED